jgi:alpha-galactosidase
VVFVCVPEGSFAFALWNLGTAAANVSVPWSTLAPQSYRAMTVRDLWAREDLGVHDVGYSTIVPGHGVAIIKAIPKHY